MKKTIVFTLIITFLASSILLYSGKKDRQTLYMSALMEKDQVKKFEKLELYFTKYTKNGKKKKYVTSTLYMQLVETSLKAKKFDKTLFYAEKSLDCKKLSVIDKLDVKMLLIRYYAYKKDNTKMEQLINEIKNYEKKDSLPNFDKRYLSQIQKIQIQLSAADTKTAESTKVAMLKSFKIFEANPNNQNAKIIYYFAKKLYDEFDSADDAISGLEKICSAEKVDIKYIDILAKWYKNDDIYEKAAKYLIKSYELKPNSKKAYEIGKVLTEVDVDKAIAYYAESFVRNTEKIYADKSKEKLQKLYKEEKGEGLSEEEFTAEIEKIIEAAKNRLKQ